MMVRVGKNKAKQLTDKEVLYWTEFVNERTLRIHDQQRKMICKLYSKVFSIPYVEITKECNQRPLLKMIDKLDQVYESNN
jgi:hypothetical protein